jgi:hypothetical protein
MQWKAIYLEDFKTWLDNQEESLQDETLARLDLLEQAGTLLGQPFADSLTTAASASSTSSNSLTGNLKELRFEYEQTPIRILYAFEQQQIILIQAVKAPDKRWFKANLPLAEQKLKAHLSGESNETLEPHSQLERERKRAKNDHASGV